MAQQDIVEVFEDCTNRLNQGQGIDECLRLYPEYASRLRPLLEATITVQAVRIPNKEILEDQTLVWQQLDQVLPGKVVSFPRQKINIRVQLLIAIIMLLLLTLSTWLFLTRPDVDDIVISLTSVPTATPTQVPTFTPTQNVNLFDTIDTTQTDTPTPTSTITNTPTVTATNTLHPTITASKSPTKTATYMPSPTASRTPPPTATVKQVLIMTNTVASTQVLSEIAGQCGEPFTMLDLIELVSSIFPNTTITRAELKTRSDGVQVWEVETSHNIEMTIDAECGYVLTIEQKSNSSSDPTSNNDSQSGSNSGSSSSNSGSGNSNDDNSGSSSSNSGSGNSGDDNSGGSSSNSGSGNSDDDDDHDDSGSDSENSGSSKDQSDDSSDDDKSDSSDDDDD